MALPHKWVTNEAMVTAEMWHRIAFRITEPTAKIMSLSSP